MKPDKNSAPKDKTVGAWHPSAPVAREEGERTPWIRNTDPEALEMGPINPMRLSASDPQMEDKR